MFFTNTTEIELLSIDHTNRPGKYKGYTDRPPSQLHRKSTIAIIINSSVKTLNLNASPLTGTPPKENKFKKVCIVCLVALYVLIAMTVAIVIVCVKKSQTHISCQSNFEAILKSNTLQYDSYPCAIATGDFNHDDFIDIVVVNSGINNIGLFLNYGNKTFASQVTFSTGGDSNPYAITIDDFNNDTYLDIATANYDTNNIRIFFGDGYGNFTTQTTISLNQSRPVSLTSADIDNDKRIDLIVTNNGTANIGILYGYGNGSFKQQITYSTDYDSFPSSVIVADFNNDHYQDIAIANYGTNNIGIFMSNRQGNFTAQYTFSTGLDSKPYSIAVNDFNHDNKLDLAVANSGTNNVGIFLGYGNGNFQSQQTYSVFPGFNPRSILIADFDGDNELDIAVCNYDTNDVSILNGYGNGSFASPTFHATGINSNPVQITLADFDNDNESDIAVVNYEMNNILVLIEYRLLQSSPPVYSTGDGSLSYQITIGDFNNDTIIDLVVTNVGTDSIGFFYGYGNGDFQGQVLYSTGNNSHPYAIVTNDLDNDTYFDLVIAKTNIESLAVLYGYGNGSFTKELSFFTGNNSFILSIAVDDFNNDNRLDITFTDYNSNSIGIFLATGYRTFGTLSSYSTGEGSRPSSVATGDFDNNGIKDIAVANYGTNNLYVFRGLGNGSFIFFDNYATGLASLPWSLTIADLNKDNYLDIINVNLGSSNINIFYGLGNGNFSSPTAYATSPRSGPMWIQAADLNNDDWLDLAIVEQNINKVSVFLANRNGSFTTSTSYPSGSNGAPRSLSISDFNKDGHLDIAVVNYGSNNVAVLLGHPPQHYTSSNNNATGQSSDMTDTSILLGVYYDDFVNKATYSTGSSSRPASIAFGNLNNDKNVDLIVANTGNGNLGILLGAGRGTFPTETFYSLSIGSTPYHVLIDDFNKDNQSDVAVTNPNNNTIIVLLGDGNGNFSTELIYNIGSQLYPTGLAIGDFNNDNYFDLVVANEGTNTIGIFFGFDYTFFVKDASFPAGNNSGPTDLAIGDFNNDQHLDIVISLFGADSAGVFLGYGNGSFSPMITVANVFASRPWSVEVGDFNNDTHLDIVVVDWGIDSIAIVLGYENGSFTNARLYSTGSGTRPVSTAVADFNNDNYLDIATAHYGGNSIGVFLGYGDGTFHNVMTFSAGADSRPSGVALVDINNDTFIDIISANTGIDCVGVFLGHGNGSFSKQMTFSTGSGSSPWYTVVGDLDKDGQLDLATANYGTATVSILKGYGNGSFGKLRSYTTGSGSNPTHLKLGDFNNDGYLDIIVTDETNFNADVFFGYGDGTFTEVVPVPVGYGAATYAIGIADFNNDSRLDFAIADYNNYNLLIFLANGTKPFGGQAIVPVGNNSSPSSIAIGSFNNDTQNDIAIVNSGDDSIGILLGNGDRSFSNIITYSTGKDATPSSLAIGDFNSDTFTDIVVVNSQTDDIILFFGDGNGSFIPYINYSMGINAEPVSVAVGDYNRDYRLDIAVANYGTNNVCLLYGHGNGLFTNQTWYPLGYDSRPSYVVFQDVNNDGWDDIAVTISGLDNIKILLNVC